MNPEQQKPILAIALFAAFADGAKHDRSQNLLGPAKQMQTQYLPQIQQQAGTLDMGRVMAMVHGA